MRKQAALAALALALIPGSGPLEASAAQKTGKVLWDHWYVVTVEKDHAQYYNEKVELNDGRLGCFQKVWKKEEGYINEEQLGSFAADGAKLTPLFFNFHQTYRTTETSIDGTVAGGKLLTVKARQGEKDLPLIKRSVPPTAFLQCLFPVWIGRQIPKMKEGHLIPFLTLFEDNLEVGFKPIHGTVRLEKPDEISRKSGTHKLSVSLENGAKMIWWVDPSGAVFRIEGTNPRRLFERVPKDVAGHFLEE